MNTEDSRNFPHSANAVTFPQTIKRGSASVKIYYAPVRKKSGTYDAYLVRYYLDQQMRQKKFADQQKAIEYAEEIADKIDDGTIRAALMTDVDRAEFLQAKEILGERVTLIEAARFWAERHVGNTSKTVSEVIMECLSAKREDGLSDAWLRDLNTRLGTFCEEFGPKPITDLSGHAIDDWLRKLDVGGRSRNNYRCCISTLISFAKRRKYIPRAWDGLADVPVAKNENGEIQIFTPAEMRRMLDGATRKQTLFLALGGFAGLRSQEISRLNWSEIGTAHIVVEAEKAKTGQRRLVPVLPTLKAVIEPLRANGLVLPAKSLSNTAIRISERSRIEWKQNGLRHSFISYRLALVKSTAQVALECGTSERRIFANYRQLVTEAAAKAWFDLAVVKSCNKQVGKNGEK